ncbi:MAG TPA: hypothetical protein VHM67_05890 [Gemmatimonadaceae bacterium]|nr:hypothetical protein [Gemmatimonadaceae bacterium]
MRLSAFFAAALLLTACGDDAPTEPNPNPTSRVIPTLGSGAVPERYTAEVTARGDYAYTSSWGQRNGTLGNAVKVWNVSGATPQLVETVIVPTLAGSPAISTTGDVEVSDDGTLLAVATERIGGSLALYSLADPAHPAFLSQFHSADTDPGVHTAEIERVGGKLYAFLSVDPVGTTTPARLVVLDLSNPANPVQVLARPMGNPYVHDVFVRDSLLFTALWNGGMTIWDIGGSRGGTPANPIQISNIQTVGGKVHNMWWFHDKAGGKRYVFVGEEGPLSGGIGGSASGDIHVVDISNITAPVEVAYFTVAGAGTHNFWVDESSAILYAAYYNGGVRAIDIGGDLSQCAAAARVGTRCNLAKSVREAGNALSGGFVWGVHGLGNRLYASDMLAGLKVLDISTFKR